MKTFQALAVVKQPVDVMWATVRDQMPALAAMVEDVDSITLVERTDLGAGRLRLVNEWQAAQRIPELLAKPLKVSTVGWVDTAVWDSATMICTWSIKPHVFPDHIDCQGTTSYEAAMGGRGTRVTFQGGFDLAPGALGGLANPQWSRCACVSRRKLIEPGSTGNGFQFRSRNSRSWNMP